MNYLRYNLHYKKEKKIRERISKENSIKLSLDSLINKGLVKTKKISKFHGTEPIRHYAITIKGENIIDK